MRLLLTGLVVLGFLGSAAMAKDDPAAMVREAEGLVRGGSLVDGIRLYVEALRLAEKQKDLPAQELVTRSLQHAAASGVMQAKDRDGLERSVLLVLLEGLDPKRGSAFLSRGQVAHALLLDATETGDRSSLAAAGEAAQAYAKLPRSGAHAQMMRAYAEGLMQDEAGKVEDALRSLGVALDQAAKEGWTWPAVHVAVELAAIQVKAGAAAAAAAAVRRAGDVLKGSGEYALAMLLRKLVAKRLEGAPKEVLDASREVLKPHEGGGSASSAGGAGGKGLPGGSRDRSKIGDAWKKLSKTKPFVTVTRTGAGYEIHQSYDKDFEAVQPFGKGVTHHADGGVTLSFWDGGVRLHMIDMVGNEGQPGEASQPAFLLWFHPLAAGETWGVDKAGAVTITGK